MHYIRRACILHHIRRCNNFITFDCWTHFAAQTKFYNIFRWYEIFNSTLTIVIWYQFALHSTQNVICFLPTCSFITFCVQYFYNILRSYNMLRGDTPFSLDFKYWYRCVFKQNDAHQMRSLLQRRCGQVLHCNIYTVGWF